MINFNQRFFFTERCKTNNPKIFIQIYFADIGQTFKHLRFKTVSDGKLTQKNKACLESKIKNKGEKTVHTKCRKPRKMARAQTFSSYQKKIEVEIL